MKMNPYVNNFLDDSPATHPRLMNSPLQHTATSPYRGAAALNPSTAHSNTHQKLHEKLDDVSTWDLHTMRNVATDIYKSQDLALFDLQDNYQPVTNMAETAPRLACGWNDGEYSDEEELGGNGGMTLEHEPRYADLAGTSHAPLPAGNTGPRRRKVKMYEWPPQSDPELEKRRLRALRQWYQRQREQQEIEQLQRDLHHTMREVTELAPEAARL